MNHWAKRLLLLFTIGGGFTGIVFILQAATQAVMTPANFLLIIAFFSFFSFGIWAGWRLVEDEPSGIVLVKWYAALQMPYLSSPLLGFGLLSALGLRLGIGSGGFTFTYRLGSEAWLSLGQGAPWGISINVVAVALFILCSRSIPSTTQAHSFPTDA